MVAADKKVRKRNPRSHKHGLTVAISDKRGLHVYFRKKPSGFAQCVGEKVRKKAFGKGVGREAVRKAFTEAAKACSKE